MRLHRCILLFVLILLIVSCDSTEPTDGRIISIEAVDASCTEAWLNVALKNVPLPAKTILTRNDSLVGEYNLFSADTVIIDEGLNPSTDYSFKLSLANGSINSTASIRTMDTTSHNFTWQTWEFGAKSSSSFYDVAIINENNIWAVGEIYTEDTYTYDSNGVWQEIYNAAHWDGQDWELKRFEFYTFCNQTHTGIYPAKAIIAFSDSNIFISSGSRVTHFNGTEQTKIECIPTSVIKFWGESSQDFYAVGHEGRIARYKNEQWINLGSVTDLDIYDIWGDYDERTGSYEIIAVAAKLLQSTDRDIFKIVGNNVFSLDEKGINWSLRSTWFESGKKYFATGSGIFSKTDLNQESWKNEPKDISQYYINSTRGTGQNNIFMCGAFGEVLHFNGKSWYSYLGKELPFTSGSLTTMNIKKNNICIVGYDGRNALIYLGKK